MARPDPAPSGADDSAPPEPGANCGARRYAAAVIAFVLVAFEVVAGFSKIMDANEFVWGSSAYWYSMGVLNFGFAGLLVWGGIATLGGSTNKFSPSRRGRWPSMWLSPSTPHHGIFN
ncbi:hypothetical protein MycrhDRAFT_5568 [Mycolicibacterium rhodesiae JS60]|nr:hypothetical protein MycrhDRAFT_5568 [Mycolicibacterium rhodesiae JS60]